MIGAVLETVGQAFSDVRQWPLSISTREDRLVLRPASFGRVRPMRCRNRCQSPPSLLVTAVHAMSLVISRAVNAW
jgi:hypothetical protein